MPLFSTEPCCSLARGPGAPRSARGGLASLLLALAVAQPGTAHAAPEPHATAPAAAAPRAAAPRAAADASPGVEELIQRGIALRRAGDDAAALEVFHRAERKSPGSVRIMLHIVTAAQAAGRWLEASAYLREVSEHKDDPYYRQYREEIAQVEKVINTRVGSFLAIGTPAGAEVRINGNVIGTLPMERAEPIQSGSYQLEVSLPGYYNERRTIGITGGVLAREAFALNLLPKAPVASAARASGAEGALVTDDAPREWYEQPWLTWALAGTSAALLTTSVVAFALREDHAARWNDDDLCTPRGGGSRAQNCAAEREAAERAQTIGVVTGVAGLTFAGAALAQRLILVDRVGRESAPANERRPPEPQASARCGIGFLGVSCRGEF
jgi:PEGA domain-containing protein/tetratricopeptide repeat protein